MGQGAKMEHKPLPPLGNSAHYNTCKKFTCLLRGDKMNNIRFMVYNTQHCLNYLKRYIDYPLIAEIINNMDCSFVGLNEIRGEGPEEGYDDQTAILSSLTNMPYSCFGEAIKMKGNLPYGNAFISKLPIIKAEVIPVPDPEVKNEGGYYETRCLIKVKLECGLTILVIHFGLNPSERRNAVATVLENLEDEKCILMGDFNSEPDDPIIAPLKEKLFDTSELFDEPKLSFPSDKPRIKIDYIFTTKDLKVNFADIPAIVGADHRPYVAEITLP